MCEAIFSGVLAADIMPARSVWVTDILAERLDFLHQRYGVQTVHNTAAGDGARQVVQNCQVIVLAVKPQFLRAVLDEAGAVFSADKIVISIVGGVTLETLQTAIPGVPVLRVMPNTPMLVGKGCAAISPGALATEEHIVLCRQLFDAVGDSVLLSESLQNSFTAVSGAGPAFAYMFIEALADGGVQQGLPRALAQQNAAQMLVGAAEMVLQTGQHPGQLKDNVCSPGGGTIAGVRALEEGGFRAAVMDAVERVRRRMDELG